MFAAKKTDQVSAGGGIQYVGGTSGSFTYTTAGASTTISLTSLTGGIASAPSLGDLIVLTLGGSSGTAEDRGYSSGRGLAKVYANDTERTVFAFYVKYALVAEDLTAVRIKSVATGTTKQFVATVHVYRNATGYFNTSTDVASIATINTAIPNPPSITPTVAGSIIHVGASNAHTRATESFTASYLSNFITLSGANLSEDCQTGAGYVTWTSGAYDPDAWTWSGTDDAAFSNCSASLVIAPKVAVTAPTWVGGDTAVTTTSSLVLNKPSGTAQNDLLVAICVRSATSGTWTNDGTWTEATDANGISVHYKTAGASEGSSYTFTQSTTADSFGIIMAFRNAAWDLIGASTSAGTNLTLPAITLTSNNSTVIAFARGGSSNDPDEYGAEINDNAYTYVYRDVMSSNTWSSITAIREGVASGSTGTVSVGTYSKDGRGFLIGIKPA